MTDILTVAQLALLHPLTRFVLALLVANFVTGLMVAFHPNTAEQFRLGQVADWMVRALFLVIGAVTVQVLAYFATADYRGLFEPVAVMSWGIVIAALVGKVLQNLRELGLPVPDTLGDKSKPDVTVSP